MPATRRQAVMPQAIVDRLLLEASPGLVLVGGQALKVWATHYGVALPDEFSFVSYDVDFLAESAADTDSVRRLARALEGRAVFPRRREALTALVGQAVRDVSTEEVFNVAVLHRVYGASDALRTRAVDVALDRRVRVRVMHPLDVLKSRLDNLHGIKDKQNDLGQAQLRAAITVVRAFQIEAARPEHEGRTRRPATLRYAAFIEDLATSAAGKKVAARYDIHVADAIEPSAIPSREFRGVKLPQLARLMSKDRRKELALD